MPELPDLPELVVHIGAGKTGSTAIQQMLRDGGDRLAGQGVAYLGLMLEQLPAARRHDWCRAGAPQRFFQAADKPRADAELLAVLRAELARLAGQGIRRAIWSNEAFLVQKERILPVLAQLAAGGVTVVPVAYLRRHDRRARSAYVELALKSKRNRGGIRPFRDWAKDHPLRYGDHLAAWRAAFPRALRLYNFDAAGDVGRHFAGQMGLEGLTPVRANPEPDPAMLAAWTVFNAMTPDPTWADDFLRMAEPLKLHDFRTPPVPPLARLLPDAEDLAAVQARCRDDAAMVNALLAEQGQPPLSFEHPADPAPAGPPPWAVDRMLLRMVYALQDQVRDLQEQLAELRADREDG